MPLRVKSIMGGPVKHRPSVVSSTPLYRNAGRLSGRSTRPCLLFLFLLFFFMSPSTAASQARVVIVIGAPIKIYKLITQGINQIVHGETHVIDLSRSKKESLQTIRKIRPQVVVAVGDQVALWAKKTFTRTPVIASGVVHQSNPQLFKNMAGVSLDFSLQAYLQLIQESFPQSKRVGLFFNPSENNRLLRDAQKAATALNITLDAEPVGEESKLGQAIQSLNEKGTQIILMTYDPLFMNPETWKYLVDFSIRHRMGLVVPSKTLLKNGGFISLEANYLDVGRQTGVMVNRVIENPDRIQNLHLEFPNQKEIGVNLKMINIIDMKLSKSVLKRANHVQR